MTGPAQGRASSRWMPRVLIALAIVALAALVVAISQDGPDHTVTGTVTARQAHRVCVGRPTGPDVCAHADSPESISGVSTGDCVRIRYSAEDLLVSLDRVSSGCEAPTSSSARINENAGNSSMNSSGWAGSAWRLSGRRSILGHDPLAVAESHQRRLQ